MALSRSRLRSELSAHSSAETKRLLAKIKSQHLVIQIGTVRFKGSEAYSLAIDETLGSANIQVARPGIIAQKSSLVLQDLTYTAATAGAAGNSITVAYTTGGTAGSEVVTVVGSAISVQIQTGVSTATQVRAAVLAAAPAAALVAVAISGTGSHPQTAPVAPTALAGGSDTPAVENYDLADIQIIRRLRTKKWLIHILAGANPA